MKAKRNKKGNTSVFLVFILTAMIGMTAAFIYAARESAIHSISDGVLNLAMRSVLSKFDLELKQRYGLFAFEQTGNEAAILRSYAEYSFSGTKVIKMRKAEVSAGPYSLGEPAVLKKQILDYMKFAVAKDLISKSEKGKTGPVQPEGGKDRTLRNKKVIQGLPSTPFKENHTGFLEQVEEIKSRMGSVKQVFDETKDTYLLDRYILQYFNNRTKKIQDWPSFFNCEAEYILEGSYSNEENRKKIKQGLTVLRSGFNALFLYTDPQKRSEIVSAAEMLTPGPAALVTQVVLTGTWALAEADNDVKLLIGGKPVVLLKDAETWATDLEAVINNKEGGCIDTNSGRGYYYEDYLMICLHFMNENLKLARIADLIQINMKGSYDRDFLVKTSSGGMHLKAEINGRDYEYYTEY